MRAFLVILLFAGAARAADEAAADFASTAAIDAAGTTSHFRVRLTPPAYRASLQRGLADLRVTNGAGEFVPFAFAPREAPRAAPPEIRAAKLFPLHAEIAKPVDGLSLRVERSASGTVVKLDAGEAPRGARSVLLGYIVELPEMAGPLQALVFDWEARSGFTAGARIEASDDLKQWRSVALRAPLIQLEHAGERLERKRVEGLGLRAKYLRVSFSGVPADFTLKGIGCETGSARPEPVRDSLTFAGVQDVEKKNEYRFDTGGGFPVERVRFTLPQANTIAPVQVLVRSRTEDQWRHVASATAYRLSRDDGEITNPDIDVGAVTERQWLLRVDPRAGGLGSGEVQLVIAWQPHEIVFAARGTPPFALLAGSKTAAGAALPLATIVPGAKDGDAIAATPARLGEFRPNARAPATPQTTLESARAFAGSAEGRKWLLWAVLVAGVLFLAWMAMRLLRDLDKRANPPKSD